MKKSSRKAPRKAGKKSRKSIMRHSREGVRSRTRRSTKPGRSAKTARTAKRRSVASKAAPRSRSAKPKTAAEAKPPTPRRLRRGSTESGLRPLPDLRGLGPGSAGQSGDLESLSELEDVDSESVEELVEEGQAFEAGVISGVEEADAGSREVRTREVSMDDVPQEYLDED
jgi:hypothetical protein